MSYDAQLELIYSNKATEDLGVDYWVVNAEFTCVLDTAKDQYVIIPQGFLTDGASVPRMFWSFFPSWGKYGQAATVHDFLCEYLIISDNGRIRNITREECDKYFLKLMIEMKINRVKRTLMYQGVSMYRRFGKVKTPSITAKKVALENLLLDHYNKHGIWL